MTKRVKVNTGLHTAQEPHDAAHCQINDPAHSHPGVDCGHYVSSGPGYQIDEDSKTGPGVHPAAPKHDDDQDTEHGPGVK